MSDTTISRRKALALAAGAAGAVATGAKLPTMSQEKPKGSLKQSVCRWCFGDIAMDDLCAAGKNMGLVGIDLLNEGDFATTPVRNGHLQRSDSRSPDCLRKWASSPGLRLSFPWVGTLLRSRCPSLP